MIATTSTLKTARRVTLVTIAAAMATLVATQAGLAQGPDRAAQTNPYLHVDDSRDQLQERYPQLPARELDMLTFRIADINSLKPSAPVVGPAGDWSCTTDAATGVRLTIRAKSYWLVDRSGRSWGGEYERAGQVVRITNGPLKGMGIADGTLTAAIAPRILEFHADGRSALRCREVL